MSRALAAPSGRVGVAASWLPPPLFIVFFSFFFLFLFWSLFLFPSRFLLFFWLKTQNWISQCGSPFIWFSYFHLQLVLKNTLISLNLCLYILGIIKSEFYVTGHPCPWCSRTVLALSWLSTVFMYCDLSSCNFWFSLKIQM